MTDAQRGHDVKAAFIASAGNEAMAGRLSNQLALSAIPLARHRFPDGESLVRVDGDVTGRPVVIGCTLDRPDAKLAPLVFAADALALLEDAGAAEVVTSNTVAHPTNQVDVSPLIAASIDAWLAQEDRSCR